VSDPIDIKALDEYLKGGSDISQRYRELGSEDVPPELDRRVLGEARTAVASAGGGRARSWLRWSAPLAVAASVVLVVTVVIESGVQNDASFATQQVAADKVRVEAVRRLEESQRQAAESKLQEQVAQPPQSRREQPVLFAPEPSPAAIAPQAPAVLADAPPAPAALAKAEIERSNSVAVTPPEEVRVDAKVLNSPASDVSAPITAVSSESLYSLDSSPPQIAAEQPTPSVTTATETVTARQETKSAAAEADSADDALSSVSITGARTARRNGRTAGPRGTISGSALSTETRPAADEDTEQAELRADPQKWLESIRELRRTGKVEAADRAWQEFHKTYPDFPVADDDLARKQR
jgi:hypothetical protein